MKDKNSCYEKENGDEERTDKKQLPIDPTSTHTLCAAITKE